MRRPAVSRMSFRAEPFGVFVDDLVSSLTGGVTRETFRFLPELAPFRLAGADELLADTVRVHGLRATRTPGSATASTSTSTDGVDRVPRAAPALTPRPRQLVLRELRAGARPAGAAAADRPQPRQRPAHARRELRPRVRRAVAPARAGLRRRLHRHRRAAATSTSSSRSSASSGARSCSPPARSSSRGSTPAPGDITIEAGDADLDERRAGRHRDDHRDAHAAHRVAVGDGAGASRGARRGRGRGGRHAHRDPPPDPRHHQRHEPGADVVRRRARRPTTRCVGAPGARSTWPPEGRPGRSSARWRPSTASATRTSGSSRTTSASPAWSRSPSPARPRRRAHPSGHRAARGGAARRRAHPAQPRPAALAVADPGHGRRRRRDETPPPAERRHRPCSRRWGSPRRSRRAAPR